LRGRYEVIIAAWIVAICSVLRMAPLWGEPLHFDIPAGEVKKSLGEFGHQAHRYLYYGAGVEHQRTRAISGDFEHTDALRRLLEGSGLVFASKNGIIYIEVMKPPPAQTGTLADQTEGPSSTKVPHTTIYVKARAVKENGIAPTELSVESQELDIHSIEQSGAQNAADLMHPITSNFGGGASENTQVFGREAPTNTAYGSSINLRGLGSRATLVLVDGRRLAPSGSDGAFFDISNIPLSAIQQVQVIPDGDSVLLGADAIGGVVNFVLRRETTDPETRATFGGLGKSSLGEHLFSQSIVWQRDWGGGLLAGEYYDRDALYAFQRAQATSDLTPWGGGNFGNPAGNPGTLVTTLPNGSQQYFGIPTGQNGTGLKVSQLTPGPILHNLFDDSTILPHQQRLSVTGTADLKLSDDLTLWGDVLTSRRRVEAQAAGLTAALSIPATNPWYVNPVPGSSVQVLYGFGQDLGAQTLDGEVDSGQFSAGVTYALTPHWNLTGYGSYAVEYQRDVFGNLVNFTALQPYLESSDPSTAFDAFGDGSHTNPATLAAIRLQRDAHYRSGLTTLSGSASGTGLTLPTGDIVLTLGMDYRIQTFASDLSATDSTSASTFDATRHMETLYALAIVPLMRPDDSKGHLHRLELSAGVRDERYSDVGNALAPQLGLMFSPTPDISIRAGWAKLFRPPNLSDLSEATNLSMIFALPDSHSPTGISNALVWTGGNSALRPESAQSLTGGFTVNPSPLPGLSVSATYFHTVFDQIIENFDITTTALEDPQYSWLVSRNPSAGQRAQVCARSQFEGLTSDCLTAPISALVDIRLQNAASLKTDGIDVASRYTIQTTAGQLKFGLDATYVLRYAQANTPTSPITSELNTPHYPIAFRAKPTIGWETPHFWSQVTLNYQGGYEDTDSVPHRPISPWSTWDVSAGYQVSNGAPGFAGQIQLIASALNIFNSDPPFLNNTIEQLGYDEENGNLLGRRVSIQVQIKW
jgi:iron complex outermembrane recepter protein